MIIPEDIPLPRVWFPPPFNEEWHKKRRRTIGASEVASILGINPYGGTARTVYLEKKGEAPPWQGSEATWWGNCAEPIIAREFGRRMERRVESVGAVVHPRLPYFVCTPDFKIPGLPCLVQIKTRSSWAKGWGKPGTDQVPPHYVVQLMAEMACAPRVEWAYLVAQRDSSLLTYIVPRHAGLIELVENAVERFWTKYIETGELPKDIDNAPPAVLTLDGAHPSERTPGVEGTLELLRGFPVRLTVSPD